MAVLIVVVTAAATGQAAARSAAAGRLVTREFVHARTGGYVRAADGAAIFVPPHVMSTNGWVTIRALQNGEFAIAIHTKWSGEVRVTLPGAQHGIKGVMHYVDGQWTIYPGAASVWLDHLSLTSTINDFLGITDCTLDVAKAAVKTAAWTVLGTAAVLAAPEDWGTSAVLADLSFEAAAEAAGDVNAAAWAKCLVSHGVHNIAQALFRTLTALTQKAFSGSCATLDLDWLASGQNPCNQGVPLYSPPKPVTTAPTTPNSGQPNTASTPTSQTPTSSPPPSGSSPTPTPTPPAPSGTTEGFYIDDDIYGGTWARTDPNDGTWYPHSTPPPNGAYWYPYGLGVAVSCAESAAPYTAVIYGQDETWSWWAHVTDGKWVPVVVFSTVWSDGLPAGLPEC
jgi:hypothetical protein